MGGANSFSEQFEADRSRLQALAYRMLGSPTEAEDAVQEAWVRLLRAGEEGVGNVSGWLTTVVSRVCLDMLRARKSRREDPVLAEDNPPEVIDEAPTPEQVTALSDAVGYAMQVVLDTLGPAERVAFVLHDIFGLSFEEIAPIVGRSEASARQLASRARRRVRGASRAPERDFRRKRELIEAFLAASRGGDLQGLLAVLDPNVQFRVDPSYVAQDSLHGREAVASLFLGRAQAARPALLDGDLGIVVRRGGKVLFVLRVETGWDSISVLEAIGNPVQLAALDITDIANPSR